MGKKKIYIIFRNDDPCAFSDPIKERKILEIFEKYRIPQVVSVIPHAVEDPHDCHCNQYRSLNENPRMVALLKEYYDKGLIEIAQHGFTHQTNESRPNLRAKITDNDFSRGIDRKWLPFCPAHDEGYSEFKGLTANKKEAKIVLGRKILEDILNIRVSTFAFPWDSLDQECLDILDAKSYQTVLCDHNTLNAGRLNLITACHNDIFTLLDFFTELKAANQPVLTHIEYHSWMLNEDDLAGLDRILGKVSSMGNVHCITASKSAKLFPNFNRIRDAKRKHDTEIERMNVHLGKKKSFKKYFGLGKFRPYLKFLKIAALSFFIRKIGYERALGLSTAGLIAFFLMKSGGFPIGQYVIFNYIALAMLLLLFFVSLALNIRKYSNVIKR